MGLGNREMGAGFHAALPLWMVAETSAGGTVAPMMQIRSTIQHA